MPYQPMSPSPYLTVIDSTIDNIFTCVINPRDVVSAYVLKIIDINSTTGTPILTVTDNGSGITYSGTSEQIDPTDVADNSQLPIYGNYKSDSILKIPIPANYILDKSSENENTENRLYGDYVWNITLYDQNNNSTTSCDYYFKVRDKANIVLSNNDVTMSDTEINVINSSSIHIQSEYSQAQNILPAYYCFNIYLNNKVVYTTGNIISSNIMLDYDALIDGNDYTLELLVYDDDKTQNRYIYQLKVSYDYFSAPINPVVAVDTEKSYASVDYSYNISIVGKTEEDGDDLIYKKYIDSSTDAAPSGDNTNGVCIPKNQILYWNEKSIGVPLDLDDTYQVINWHGHKGYNGIIVQKIDEKSPSNNIIVGHDITSSATHERDSFIYINETDQNMPMGISTNNIRGGFYYKFGISLKVYISEFSKITSAIYKSETETAESVATNQMEADTLYVLNDNDTLSDTNIILNNDTTNEYWWVIGILKDRVTVFRNERYSETVVNE